ncbi:MAG: PQQ-dependent sugar dehydrogenase [Chloroflexota bacterium]|nr:PQQ-dependent sugar dehydrogenase [Chloroflexota bacterium]
MRTRLLLTSALLSGLVSGTAQAGQPRSAQAEITFPQTGMTLSSAHGFLDYWQAHGGLAQFGYPLTPETMEVSPTDRRTYITQWFERNRFEYHPEIAASQYRVLLGLLGRDLARGREQEAPFRPVPNPRNSQCQYFPETGHSVCNSFRKYWEQHGALAIYGFPISEEFSEKSPTDGKTYTVQYFERNRFEYHPENRGTQHEVLLSLLGVQLGGFPLQWPPQANARTALVVPEQFKRDEQWTEPPIMTGPPGMRISLFGTGRFLRMMAVAPNGDLFVSSTRTGEVLVMPDRNADGVADETKVFASDLHKPHGLAFRNGFLYVACEGEVLRFPYSPGQLEARGEGQRVAELPIGMSQGLVKDVNHDTRSITFGADGKMYISIGSDCDVCEQGDPRRATIMQFNEDGSQGQVYARGLRNAVGIDVDPRTGRLWASVNERNQRGSEFPPDLLTPIRAGGDYGWPYCLGVPLQPDPQFNKPAEFCHGRDSAAVPLHAHIAPLGIRFYNGGGQLPKAYDYSIFVAMHGTALSQGDEPPLRKPPVGYDVRFVSLRPGRMGLGDQVIISGWHTNGDVWGRPVDVVFGKDGAMYISDDAAHAVYRVTVAASGAHQPVSITCSHLQAEGNLQRVICV